MATLANRPAPVNGKAPKPRAPRSPRSFSCRLICGGDVYNLVPLRDLDPGTEVVVVGRTRRRFWSAGGATRSQVEVLATTVVPARAARSASWWRISPVRYSSAL